jgi:hypothetical protein
MLYGDGKHYIYRIVWDYHDHHHDHTGNRYVL